ncbi:VOC family protein [Kibdelosporangium philippinense]|uniref:VOC family protein n=1 Tax=Kibdelosporangium philippinense TaxID=211113 RepID=A0ABS8ZYM7_9PSEU|nr:VOC family protein [Kibdelosporangium philippinense]MCE7012026.1 VOC family protein [Kibdelosporangium philippinense]
MSTRLVNVIIATASPEALSQFWSQLLGWDLVREHGEIDVRAPESQGWDLDLVFDQADEPKTAQNRIHLDLASASPADQAEIIERARDLGAKSIDIGQGDVPWEVMADPDGNEFCVLEPREIYHDAGPIAAIVVQAVDANSLAEFWINAAGFERKSEANGDVGLRAPNARGPWLEFLGGYQPKTGQNRLHLDVRPYAGVDQRAEVARLTKAGARPIDIGQGDVPWEVMADPEDNEFCVLTPR